MKRSNFDVKLCSIYVYKYIILFTLPLREFSIIRYFHVIKLLIKKSWQFLED